MKMFKATFYGCPNIEEVDVDRKTEASVFVSKDRREAIRTEYHQWCNTHEEAKDACIQMLQLKVDKAKANLEYYENYLTHAKNL